MNKFVFTRATAIALCSGVALTQLPVLAHAQTTRLPADEVAIAVTADGTHKGPGTNTFLNSANGYNPGDNNANDGVVSSGDIVTYNVKLNIAAGPARTVKLRFASQGDALNLADFRNLQIGTTGVTGKWVGDGFEYQIARGAVANLEGSVIVRAKDTAGKTVGGNVVEASLTNNGTQVSNAKTQDITVISAPLADLTIDSVFTSPPSAGFRSYTQNAARGEFRIDPVALKVPGFSTHGITAATPWRTDIDVSAFPQGTTWSLGGKSLTPVGRVLKDVTGTGSATLTYVLPAAAKPTEANPSQVYQISLNVHPDSFAAGDQKNITDPGNGQGKDYNTATYKWNGSEVGALKGYMAPNNNYSQATWYFYETPAGMIWRYDKFAPNVNGYTYFESPNLYWDGGRSYHEQGLHYPSRGVATSDNDMYNRLLMLPSNMSSATKPSSVVVGDKLDTGSGANYEVHNYDLTRRVVVTVGGAILDPAHYKAEFLVGGRWIESDTPMRGAKESRVTFSDDAFVTGAGGSGVVYVYWPVKAGMYDRDEDRGKLLHSTGSFTADGVTGNKSTMMQQAPLAFMQPPTVATTITAIGDATANNSGGFDTKWKISDTVNQPHVSREYDAVRTLTLDPVYDASTFTLTKDSGWVVETIQGNTVTLRKSDFAVQLAGDRASTGDVEFTVSTVANPAADNASVITGNVAQNIELSWDRVVAFSETSDSASAKGSQSIPTMNVVGQFLRALDERKEIDDVLSWEVVANLGRVTSAGTRWTQDIVLPYNGDIERINTLNRINGSNITIDPNTGLDTSGMMDGVGRSKFDGTYTLSSLHVTDAPPNSTITLLRANGSVIATRPVREDGTVDLAGLALRNTDVRTVRVNGVDNSSGVQTAGVKVTVGIDTDQNVENNVYVLWSEPTRSPNAGNSTQVMAWPDDIAVVDSELEGTLWEDANRNGRMDAEETERYAGVTVELQQQNAQGQWVRVSNRQGEVYRETTDENGKYRFEKLHSGEYRVVLANVTKTATDTLELQNIAGGKDGELELTRTNRFGVTKTTELTRSYRQWFQAATSTVTARVGVNSTLKSVDFGFVVHGADLALDKRPAQVTRIDADTSQVTWDVEVKNTGKNVISGATLGDRTSSEVTDVRASVGYTELQKWGITGEVLSTTGGQANAEQGGYLVVTTDGVWVGGGTVPPTKFSGIIGEVLSTTGRYPNSIDGYLVATTDGVWVGSGTTPSTKLSGITGEVLSIAGNNPNTDSGYLVATTDGVWTGSGTTATKLSGITGEVLSIAGEYPNSRSGYLVATTDGVWVGNDRTPPVKMQGKIRGEVISILATDPGSSLFRIATTEGVWESYATPFLYEIHGYTGKVLSMVGDFPYEHLLATTDGVWLGRGTMPPTKLSGITGTVLSIVGNSPNTVSGGYLVATTDGVWRGRGTMPPTKLSGITGTVLSIAGNSPNSSSNGYMVATTEGVWVGVGTPPAKLSGITGEVLSAIGEYPGGSPGYLVATTDGVWQGSGSGILRPTPLFGTNRIYHHDQTLMQNSTPTTENAFGRDWIRRGYTLPDILPGESITVRFTGTVRTRPTDLVVGNQAWVTSPDTPREGLQRTSNYAVTGTGMQPGVPDIPQLPAYASVQEDGIRGTRTVALNLTDVNSDSTATDDLADQTPARIAATPTAPLSNASISGVAWYDTEKNNIREDHEERVVGVKVTAMTAAGTVVGETYTNERGEWKITGLRDGETLTISYDVVGHMHDDKVWTPVVANPQDRGDDSDVNETGVVVRTNAIARTGGNTGMADAGLQVVDANVTVAKAIKDVQGADSVTVRGERSLEDAIELGSAADLAVAPDSQVDVATTQTLDSDNDPRTNTYRYTITNSGQERLSNIALTDTTTAGLPAVIGAQVKSSLHDAALRINDQNVVTDQEGNVYVLAPGETLTAQFRVGFTTGNETHSNTLAVTAQPINGNDTPIGTPVGDDDEFTTNYEFVPAKRVTLRKVDDSGRVTGAVSDQEKTLEGAGFKVEQLAVSSIDLVGDTPAGTTPALNVFDQSQVVREIGSFVTDEQGNFTIDLPSGVYRVTETFAPEGYVLPDRTKVAHLLEVRYDKQGNPQLLSKTVYAADADENTKKVTAEVDEPAAQNWGTVEIDNVEEPKVSILLNLPRAGGVGVLLITLAGILTAAVASVIRRKQ